MGERYVLPPTEGKVPQINHSDLPPPLTVAALQASRCWACHPSHGGRPTVIMCCQRPDECTSIYGVDGCFTAAINKSNGLGLDLQGAPDAVHLLLKWPRQLHVCV